MKEILVILFLILVCSPLGSGTYISLTTQVSKEEIILKNETQLKIKLLNSGDETAYQVQVHFLLPPQFQAPILSVGNLVPQVSYVKEVTLKINENLTPGTYPLGILTYYQDANGYPFSSSSFSLLIFKKVTSSSVFGAMRPLSLAGKETKELTLKVRNLDQKDHQIKVNLFLPRELKSTSNEKILNLKPKEERDINFDISSFGALPGSSYAVFVALTYKENDLHYSSLARGTVKIVEKKEVINFSGWFPLIALIVLVLIVVIYQFRK